MRARRRIDSSRGGRGRAVTVDAFLAQTDAVLAHDAGTALGDVQVPTLITFGARDLVCSTRFAEPLSAGSPGASWCSTTCQAGLHEDSATFNRTTLDFLQRQS